MTLYFQACTPQRLQMSPHTISNQMMINLNYEEVQKYKEKVGIKKRYTGKLKKLVDVEFPDEMEPIGNPPLNEDIGLEVGDELMVDSDTYTDSEDAESDTNTSDSDDD